MPSPTASLPPAFGLAEDAGASRTRVTAEGELDMASAPALGLRLDALASAGRDVQFDGSRLAFVDTTGLRELLDARRDAERAGRRLQVIAAGEPLCTLIERTRTGHLYDPAAPSPASRRMRAVRRRAAGRTTVLDTR